MSPTHSRRLRNGRWKWCGGCTVWPICNLMPWYVSILCQALINFKGMMMLGVFCWTWLDGSSFTNTFRTAKREELCNVLNHFLRCIPTVYFLNQGHAVDSLKVISAWRVWLGVLLLFSECQALSPTLNTIDILCQLLYRSCASSQYPSHGQTLVEHSLTSEQNQADWYTINSK